MTSWEMRGPWWQNQVMNVFASCQVVIELRTASEPEPTGQYTRPGPRETAAARE